MNKIIHIIFAVSTIIVLLSGAMVALPQNTAHAMSGSGTSGDPYIITSAQDLQDMSLDLSAYYALGGDVDCSVTSTWNDGEGFLPVGTWSTPFSGSLDGNNYIISNLYINRTDESSGESQGLFCYCESAVIENITLEDFNIQASYSRG